LKYQQTCKPTKGGNAQKHISGSVNWSELVATSLLPASAGACLWQAAPGNAHPILARHNKDKTTIPFRHP